MKQNIKIWLSEPQLLEAKERARNAGTAETGGLLLGYRVKSGEVVVQRITAAGPNAAATEMNFRPDYENDVAVIARHFRESNGLTTYLGDWHTHPKTRIPYLSRKDRRTLRRVAITPLSRNSEPISMILAGSDESWDVRAWVGRFRKLWLGFWAFEIEQGDINYYRGD